MYRTLCLRTVRDVLIRRINFDINFLMRNTKSMIQYKSRSNLYCFCRYSPEELHAMVDLKPEKKEED